MSSKYEMWLTYNAEKNKIKFPVLPDKITIKNGGQNTSVNIVGLGEITIRRDRKAFTYSFSSFLPAKSFPATEILGLTLPTVFLSSLSIAKGISTHLAVIVSLFGME